MHGINELKKLKFQNGNIADLKSLHSRSYTIDETSATKIETICRNEFN